VADVTHVAPVALFAEAVRQACFGLILGLGYPVLSARHRSNRTLEALGAEPSQAVQVPVASPSR
jgi:hypothetical protein